MSIMIGIGKNLRITPSGVTVIPNEPEVDIYIAGLVTPLSDDQIIKLNTFVASLKLGLGIIALSEVFDTLYILAGETQESSLKNLIKNLHHATLAGTPNPTFVQYEGFTGDGVNGYINTNFNPSTQGIKYLQNDNSFGFYSRTNVLNTGVDIGVRSGTLDTSISPWYPGTNLTYIRDTIATASNSNAASTNSLGVFICTRNGNTMADQILYKNKTSPVLNITGTSTTSAVQNFNFFLCCYNSGGTPNTFSIRQLSFAFMAKYLTTAMRDLIVDIFEVYMDSNGKGVIA